MTDMMSMRQMRIGLWIEISVSQKNNGNSLWHIGALRRPRLQGLDVKLLKNNILKIDILELDRRVTHGYMRKRGRSD